MDKGGEKAEKGDPGPTRGRCTYERGGASWHMGEI